MSEDNCQQAPVKILTLIRRAFAKIRVHKKLKSRLWNKWLHAETWFEALKMISKVIDESISWNTTGRSNGTKRIRIQRASN